MNWQRLLLAVVIILAAFIRLFQLDSQPPHLNWDEASLGYNAYSILQTGKDEWGQSWPLSFKAFGDYKLPGYVYTAAVSVWLFGVGEFAVRLPSALFGVLTVVLTFFLTRLLITLAKPSADAYGPSIFATLVMAISPWHVFLSRVASEANLALFFVTLGLFLFFVALYKNHFLLPLSAASFVLSVYTYNSARVVVPLLIIILIFLFRKNLRQLSGKIVVFSAAVLLFLLPAFQLAIWQDSSARYRWTTILDEGAINTINEARRTSFLSPFITSIIYNKITYAFPRIVQGYIAHFSPHFLTTSAIENSPFTEDLGIVNLFPSFLFVTGGDNYQFNVPGKGLVYAIQMPFLLLGVFWLMTHRSRFGYFLLLWMLVAPLPSAITRDSPHALRSILMLPSLQIIGAFGFYQLVSLVRWKHVLTTVVTIVVMALSVSGSHYWFLYANLYREGYSWSWQWGYKQAVEYVSQNQQQYDTILFTKKYGEPHIFWLFFTKYPPQKYHNNPTLVRYFRSDWYWVDSLDNIRFVNDWEIQELAALYQSRNMLTKTLMITSPGNYPPGAKMLTTILFLDGQKAFDLVEL